MTYNEWRDELKSNLLSVSESERRRVLDYYAEAYADRRDAGFSEREIIEDFGAPYDAAQRILCENRQPYGDDFFDEEPRSTPPSSAAHDRANARERRREERERRKNEEQARREDERARREDERASRDEARSKGKSGGDYTWVFVLLCIIFCVPLFGLVMAMVGITIGFCVAPFGVLISGITVIGTSIPVFIDGNVAGGLCSMGLGVIIAGVGVVLIPLFIKLVGLMWKAFNSFFNWLKSLFSGRERA